MLSTPRFAAFGPDRLNIFVTYPPFVWLPAVLVLAALAGHLIIVHEPSRRRLKTRAIHTGWPFQL